MAKPIRHGTTTAYAHHKCRCAECRAAVARYNNERQKAIRAGTWQPGRPPPPKLEKCIGPSCERSAKYSTRPLCGGHLQQADAGKPLTPLIKKRRREPGSETKVCSRCEESLPLSDFYRVGEKLQSACKTCQRLYLRARKYGVSLEELERWIDRKNCEICGREIEGRQVHIDHCHERGHIRGVLCLNCNTALGLMREDSAAIEAMLRYLKRSV